MVTRTAAYEYWDGPAKASFACVEGAWTDNDKYKLGGYFASELHNGDWVALSTVSTMACMKASASTDVVIGQLVSEPLGPHVANSRHATVQLLGDFVKEVEIDPASTETISYGGSVKLTASGGYFGEGLWNRFTPLVVTGSAVVTMGNGTLALGTAGPTCSTGTVIPVLFGFPNKG
jgi:hypothetical protein